MTRKEIARDLDRGAARAEMVGARPATSKQVWFIAGLLEQSGGTPAEWDLGCVNTGAVLTCARASAMIDQIKTVIDMRAAA